MTPDLRPIRSVLAALRGRLRAVRMVRATAQLVAGIAIAIVLSFAIDRLLDLPIVVRAVHLAVAAVGLIALAFAGGCGGDEDSAADGAVNAPDADPNAPDADPNAPDADTSTPDADTSTPDANPLQDLPRGLAWVRENPMFISGLTVSMPPPDTGLSGPAIGAIVLAALALILGAVALLRSRSSDDDALPVTEAVLHDLSDGSQLPLSKRITRVGRAPDNDLVIDCATISGRHALIEARGGVYHVADLRSTNGTFVNENRIEGETVLRRGDILRFDNYKYAFDGVLMDDDQTQISMAADQTQIRLNPWADKDGEK